MPEKFATTNVYTDAELLALWRECFAAISVVGQSYQMGKDGLVYTNADANTVWSTICKLEARIRAASSSGGQNEVLLRRVRG